MELREDLHILTYEGSHFIYSPLRRAIFMADEQSVDVVQRYLEGRILDSDLGTMAMEHIKRLESIEVNPPKKLKINKGSNVVIIPTQLCNFGCTYCYAQKAHQKMSVMSKATLKSTLDFLLGNGHHKKNVSFIGGGEPFTAWELIKWAVDYLEQHKKEDDILNIGITTNASLLSEDILQYIKGHNIRIGVSFEILPDIQNSQRPFIGGTRGSFDVVNNNIQKLIQNKIPYNIRSTITKLNVSRMSEMVEYVGNNYLGIRKLHLEQVTDSAEDDASFYSEYIKNFYKARETGKKFNIEVYNSISKSVHHTKERFCGGEFCVTPTGSVVACHRVSAEHETAFPLFNYGKFDGTFRNNDEAEEKYLDFSREKGAACAKCFAKWHCAGICPMERTELTPKQLDAKCDFIKEIVLRELYESLVKRLNDNSLKTQK